MGRSGRKNRNRNQGAQPSGGQTGDKNDNHKISDDKTTNSSARAEASSGPNHGANRAHNEFDYVNVMESSSSRIPIEDRIVDSYRASVSERMSRRNNNNNNNNNNNDGYQRQNQQTAPGPYHERGWRPTPASHPRQAARTTPAPYHGHDWRTTSYRDHRHDHHPSSSSSSSSFPFHYSPGFYVAPPVHGYDSYQPRAPYHHYHHPHDPLLRHIHRPQYNDFTSSSRRLEVQQHRHQHTGRRMNNEDGNDNGYGRRRGSFRSSSPRRSPPGRSRGRDVDMAGFVANLERATIRDTEFVPPSSLSGRTTGPNVATSKIGQPKREKLRLLPCPIPTKKYIDQTSRPLVKRQAGPDGKLAPKPLLLVLDMNGTFVYRVNRHTGQIVRRAHLDEFVDALAKGVPLGGGSEKSRKRSKSRSKLSEEHRDADAGGTAKSSSSSSSSSSLSSLSQPTTTATATAATEPELSLSVVVWSSATAQNVNGMVQNVFPSGLPNLITTWDRSHLRLGHHAKANVQVYKQLSWIWQDPGIQRSYPAAPATTPSGRHQDHVWDQTNTILIDDTAEKGASEPGNIAVLPEFDGDVEKDLAENGPVLVDMLEYIRTASAYEDVSVFMTRYPFAQGRWRDL